MAAQDAQPATPAPNFWRRWSSLPVLPLAILIVVIFQLYLKENVLSLHEIVGLLSPYFFMTPEFSVSLITIFCLLYIYKAIRGSVPIYSQVIAWLFIFAAIAAPAYIYSASGMCTGFFGVQTSCVSTRAITVAFLLLYNFVALLWDGLALSGIVTLFIKQKRK